VRWLLNFEIQVGIVVIVDAVGVQVDHVEDVDSFVVVVVVVDVGDVVGDGDGETC
jgi:hypothetical protein